MQNVSFSIDMADTFFKNFCGDRNNGKKPRDMPENPYHRAWNDFMRLTFAAAPLNFSPKLQKLLDIAFYSCSPWWAAKFDPKERKIAAWCFPMLEEIILLLDEHETVLHLRFLLKKMKQYVET